VGAYSLGEKNLQLRPVYEYTNIFAFCMGSRGENMFAVRASKNILLPRSVRRCGKCLKAGPECEYLGTF
jgi:hypothetical protein